MLKSFAKETGLTIGLQKTGQMSNCRLLPPPKSETDFLESGVLLPYQ
jgi:hypothetical protein